MNWYDAQIPADKVLFVEWENIAVNNAQFDLAARC